MCSLILKCDLAMCILSFEFHKAPRPVVRYDAMFSGSGKNTTAAQCWVRRAWAWVRFWSQGICYHVSRHRQQMTAAQAWRDKKVKFCSYETSHGFTNVNEVEETCWERNRGKLEEALTDNLYQEEKLGGKMQTWVRAFESLWPGWGSAGSSPRKCVCTCDDWELLESDVLTSEKSGCETQHSASINPMGISTQYDGGVFSTWLSAELTWGRRIGAFYKLVTSSADKLSTKRRVSVWNVL